MEPVAHPYDHYHPSSSSSSALRERSPERGYSQHPRQHSSSSYSSKYTSSSSSSSSSSSYPHHHRSEDQQYHQQDHPSGYHRHQGQQYTQDSRNKIHSHHPHEFSSHSPQHPQSELHDLYSSHVSNAQRAYQQYAQSYITSSQHVRHTEGYEGRVRNTTRDHNDHLVTDSSARDQQHYHDQFHRDPIYGYLKQPLSPSPFSPTDDDVPAYKYQLPPIQVPEEPFYRSDLPGRHMRYFSNVTSQDRENSDGFFSSARHVAPSNTTGNFGHGPPINQTLEKFERQRQLQQQRQNHQEQHHQEQHHQEQHHQEQHHQEHHHQEQRHQEQRHQEQRHQEQHHQEQRLQEHHHQEQRHQEQRHQEQRHQEQRHQEQHLQEQHHQEQRLQEQHHQEQRLQEQRLQEQRLQEHHHQEHHHQEHHHQEQRHQEQHHQEQHHQEQRLQELRHQEQRHQERGNRLPSLFSVLPEQRPIHTSPLTPQRRDSRLHAQQTYTPPQQQQKPPTRNKFKALQPRSIAPAPIPNPGPLSSGQSKPSASIASTSMSQKNTPGAFVSERQSMIKNEPNESTHMGQYHQQQHYRVQQQQQQQHQHQHQDQRYQHSQSEGKRKWIRDHSPDRTGPHRKASPDAAEQQHQQMEETATQELHLSCHRSVAVLGPSKNMIPLQKSGGSQQLQNPGKLMQRYQLTSIRCWHGAIAQKSYGVEKRYLCPPPMVHVSAGVNTKQIRGEQPHVTMSIQHEKSSIGHQSQDGSENLMDQSCTLDDLLRCSFRNLHVTGTGANSSKRFKLSLQVFLNKNSILPTAVMDSSPIPIISKPSKKTAKAGNASCFILNGMSVSLLNRINAQTVRTKYMAVDNDAVCAKIGSWSSFTIKMVKPPPTPPAKIAPAGNMGVFRAANHSTKFVPIRMKGESAQSDAMSRSSEDANGSSQAPGQHQHAPYHQQQQQASLQLHQQQPHPQHQQQPQQEPTYVFSNSEPVLYGSEIILVNDLTGVTTDRLIIRKVENGKVIRNGAGPVSQMQKIVLQHPNQVHPEDGRPYYLSASSIGSPKLEGKIPLQAAMDRSPLLEYRTTSKKASILDLTEATGEDEGDYYEDESVSNVKRGQMSSRVPKGQENVAVDDFVCWTIAGIAKFDYTYFGPIPASVDTDIDSRKAPKVLSHPRYRSQSNTLTMKVKNVFEKLSPAEEDARLRVACTDVPYEHKLTLSELMHGRCEDVRQPMEDEEGPIQLWLAQHGPIRMRRRLIKDVLPTDAEENAGDQVQQEESDSESEEANKQNVEHVRANDMLPRIPTKPNATGRQQQFQKIMTSGAHNIKKTKHVKILSRPMGLETELPLGCEVRAAHDDEGNARAEMDILLVERATGIAYPTGYRVAYSRSHGSSEWAVDVVA